MPRSAELLRDIHETNLMYLLLLQRMARAGNLPALAGMQMSVQACQWLAALSQGMDATLAAEAPCASTAPR